MFDHYNTTEQTSKISSRAESPLASFYPHGLKKEKELFGHQIDKSLSLVSSRVIKSFKDDYYPSKSALELGRALLYVISIVSEDIALTADNKRL